MSNRSVSAIVVFRGKDYIEACLLSLTKQTTAFFEILAIDNSLDPVFTESLKSRFPGVCWRAQGENISYGRALNIGITGTRGDFILCLNDDIFLEPDFVANALEGFSRSPRIGMVSGKITRRDPGILDSTGLFVSHGGLMI